MKYISFLGKLKYSEATYQLDSELLVELYFQNIILHLHKDDKDKIDELIIATTQDGYNEHFEFMYNAVHSKHPNLMIKSIIIQDESDYESLVKVVLDKLKDVLYNQDIILDVTHCFRALPTKMLLALSYLEKSISVNVKHLYYGKIDTDSEPKTGEIIDFIDIYKESKVAESLRQFKDTLKLANVETIFEEDSDLKHLLNEMQSLNDYLELADFQNTRNCMLEISKYSKKLLETKGMERLKIYLDSIYKAFSCFNKEDDEFTVIKAIATLLSKHKYYQLACTFIYSKYERFLYDYLYIMPNKKRIFHEWVRYIISDMQKKSVLDRDGETDGKEYNRELLNAMIYYYEIDQEYDVYDFNRKLSEKDEFYLLPHLIYECYVYINEFTLKVRNPLNHANSLKMSYKDLNNAFSRVLNSIERLYKVVEKYDL